MVKWRTETYSQRAASSARPQHVLGTKHRHCNLLLIVYMGLFVAALALAPATEGEGCSSLLKLTRHSAAMAATSGKSHTQALHAPRSPRQECRPNAAREDRKTPRRHPASGTTNCLRRRPAQVTAAARFVLLARCQQFSIHGSRHSRSCLHHRTLIQTGSARRNSSPTLPLGRDHQAPAQSPRHVK